MRLVEVPRGRLIGNLAYASALLALGLAPTIPGLGTVASDGLVHATATGAQVLLLFWLLTTAISPLVAVISSGLAAFLFGGFVEVLQLFQPARYVQLSDLAANAVGSILVCITIGLVLASRKYVPGQTP